MPIIFIVLHIMYIQTAYIMYIHEIQMPSQPFFIRIKRNSSIIHLFCVFLSSRRRMNDNDFWQCTRNRMERELKGLHGSFLQDVHETVLHQADNEKEKKIAQKKIYTRDEHKLKLICFKIESSHTRRSLCVIKGEKSELKIVKQ